MFRLVTKVNAGDPLITLVNADLQMEYDKAKLHLETVQQRLDHRAASSDENESQAAAGALEAAKERLSGFSLDEAKERPRRSRRQGEGLAKTCATATRD